MATNKTLTPTNVTIAIPEMSDKPDASVFSKCVDKEVDAINTLNSNVRDREKNYTTETLKNMYDSVTSKYYEFIYADTEMTAKLTNGTITNGTGYGFALKTAVAVEFMMFVPSSRYLYTGRISSSGELLYPRRVQLEIYM